MPPGAPPAGPAPGISRRLRPYASAFSAASRMARMFAP